jgi:hypothetical protein
MRLLGKLIIRGARKAAWNRARPVKAWVSRIACSIRPWPIR